jgi:hypothetical protein
MITIRQLLLLGVTAAAAGCGGSSEKFGEFAGTWQYDNATGVLTCTAAMQTFMVNPMVDKVFQPGVSNALIDVSPSPFDGFKTCNFQYDVSGKIATMRAGQTCTLVTGEVLTPTTWRFTLTAANKGEEVGGAGLQALFMDTAGNPVTVPCDYTLMAMLTRVSAD